MAKHITTCSKCGNNYVVPTEVAKDLIEEFGGIPATIDHSPEDCPAEDPDPAEIRSFRVDIIVTELEGEDGEDEVVVARNSATTEAFSFAQALPFFNEKLTGDWQQIIDNAHLVDQDPDGR